VTSDSSAKADDPERLVAERFRDEMGALRVRAESLAIADHESESSGSLEPLFAHTDVVLREASDRFLAILEHYEAVESRRRSSIPSVEVDMLMTSIDDALDQDEGTARILTIAFLGRLGVRERLSGVRSVDPTDRWESVDILGSALREVAKAATALDVAIAECAGLDVDRGRYVHELDRAIDTRRAYVKFRGDVLASEEPTTNTVVARLRAAAAAIAKLVGRPVYAHLRTRDRHQLRTFQGRLAEFLASLGPGAFGGDIPESRARDGLRLFRDLANMTELMMQVNNRAELRANDAMLAERVLEDLADLDGLALDAALVSLEPIVGRSDELDRIVLRRKSFDDHELRSILQTVVGQVDHDGSARRSLRTPGVGSGVRPR